LAQPASSRASASQLQKHRPELRTRAPFGLIHEALLRHNT
jgi:hypothetical protein